MRAETVRSIATLAVVAFFGGTIGWIANEILDNQPFFNTSLTCEPSEVAVWADYPDTYDCVSATDHASHQGED